MADALALQPLMRPAVRSMFDSPFRANGNSSLASQVVALLASFAGPKVWLDPSDSATLYQDSFGRASVTTAGQPVGLILDKSAGLERGPERAPALVDANWAGSAGTPSMVFTGDTVECSGGVGGRSALTRLTVGKVYEASFELFDRTAGAMQLPYDGSGANSTTVAANGVYRNIFTAITTSAFLYSQSYVGKVRNVSFREVPGNHALQATAASRPLWQTSYAGFDGTDDSWATANIDFTSTDEVTVIAGVRKLSDAADGVIFELSPSSTGNGMFNLKAPGSNAVTKVEFFSRGTAAAVPFTVSATYNAPISMVVAGSAKIATPVATLRLNGAQVDQKVVTQGTGNYGTYPLFVGRRNNSLQPFNGNLYELIIIGRLLTAPELALCEQYMAQKMGIQLP